MYLPLVRPYHEICPQRSEIIIYNYENQDCKLATFIWDIPIIQGHGLKPRPSIVGCSEPRLARPHLIWPAMTRRATLMGMAKLMPWAPWAIMVLMPTTWPSMSSKGPPLLPGLMEASVWMKSLY